MADSLGKKFEQKVKEDWLNLDNISIDRIYDVTMGYKTVANVSDFIAYHYPNIFYLECKTKKGNTFSLAEFRQFDKLKQKVGIKGVRSGIVIWFYEHENCILYIPTSTFIKLEVDGKKSFNVKYIGSNEYPSIVIPSIKKRTFYDSDYSVLFNLEEGW